MTGQTTLYHVPVYIRAETGGRTRLGRKLYCGEIVHAVSERVYWTSGLYPTRDLALQAAREQVEQDTRLPSEDARCYEGYCPDCGTALDHEGPSCTDEECEAGRAS